MRKNCKIKKVVLLGTLILLLTIFYFSKSVVVAEGAVAHNVKSDIALDAVGAEAQQAVVRQILNVQDKVTSIEIKDPNVIPSLFFLGWQHALIREFKSGRIRRLPTAKTGTGEEVELRDPGIRELSLGGIAYVSAKEWTIWFNGVRLKPESLPLEVLDITVTSEFIDLKWYDPYTEKIFPVRLRPHQRFNLDSRLFLTGHITSK